MNHAGGLEKESAGLEEPVGVEEKELRTKIRIRIIRRKQRMRVRMRM